MELITIHFGYVANDSGEKIITILAIGFISLLILLILLILNVFKIKNKTLRT